MEGSYCPRCGKEFFPTPMHAYKDGRYGVPYCSWTCFNHRFDEKDEHRPIEMVNLDNTTVLKTFTSVSEALCYIGGSPKLLLRAIKTGISYKRFKWRYKN